MTTPIPLWRSLLAGALAAALLSACGGGSSATTTTSSNGNAGPSPGASTNLQPLAGGQLYLGTVSFGDSVSLQLDQPAVGQVTLNFLESQFGLAGSLSGSYSQNADGSYNVAGLTATAATPAAIKAGLAKISLRYTLQDGVLSGALGNVPNVAANDGSLLQGHVAAGNNGVSNLAQLAGVYSFIRLSGNYAKNGVPLGDQDAAAGQLKIKADGSFRVCNGQAYSDSCTNLDPASGKRLVDTGRIAAEPDQKSWPGGLIVTSGGQRLGRLFVSTKNGRTTLTLDQAGKNADGSFRTGSWVMTTTQPLTIGAQNGEWLCSEPEVSDSGRLSGRTQYTFVKFTDTAIVSENATASTALSYNAAPVATSSSSFAIQSGVNGLIGGTWTGPVNGQTRTAAQAFLPVNASTLYFLDEVNGDGLFVQGSCHTLPPEQVDNRYLAAKTGDVVQIRLGDAHPTQPAIGYDQIYYKLGKYASKPSDAFDDLCDANSSGDSAKTLVTGARLDDPSSFTCKKAPGTDASAMKSAVIGPKGKLYLTDGHHTFSSLYEYANNVNTVGANVQPYVVIKGNFADKSYAEFWQTMRSNRWVWLKDPDGQPISPAELPAGLGLKNGLANDPFRGLLYFTRDIGYTPPAKATEFLEFYWGAYLRSKMKLANYNLNDANSYLKAVTDASNLMLGVAPNAVVDAGFTAAQLGGLTVFGQAAYDKLAVPLSGAKPGKLAYALDYKAKLLPQ